VINKENLQQYRHKETGGQEDKTGVTHGQKDKPEEVSKVSSTTCKPIATERPRIELSGHKIDE